MLPHRVFLLAFYVVSFQVYWLKRNGAYPLLHVLAILLNLRFLVPHLRWLAPFPSRTPAPRARAKSPLKMRAPSPKLPEMPRADAVSPSPPAIVQRDAPANPAPPMRVHPAIPLYTNQPIPSKDAFILDVPALKELRVIPDSMTSERLAPRMLIICSDGVGLLLHREMALMYSSSFNHLINNATTQGLITLRLPDIINKFSLPDALNVDGEKGDAACLVRKPALEEWRLPQNRLRWPQLAAQGKMPYPLNIFSVPEKSDIMLPIFCSWYMAVMTFKAETPLPGLARVLAAVEKYGVSSGVLIVAATNFLRAQLSVDPFAVYTVAMAAPMADIRLEASRAALNIARFDARKRKFVSDLPGALALQKKGGKAWEDLVDLHTKRISASLAALSSATWIREVPGVLVRTSTCKAMQSRKFGKAKKRGQTWFANPGVWKYLDAVRGNLQNSAMLSVRIALETPLQLEFCKHCGCVASVEAQDALKDLVARTVEEAVDSCKL